MFPYSLKESVGKIKPVHPAGTIVHTWVHSIPLPSISVLISLFVFFINSILPPKRRRAGQLHYNSILYIYVCNPPPSTSHPLPISLKCIYFNAGTETRYSNNNLNSNISEQICRFIIRSRVFGGFSFILDKHGDVSWIQGGTGSRSQQKNNQAPDFVDTPSFNKIETYAMIRKQIKKDSITCFINFFVWLSPLYFFNINAHILLLSTIYKFSSLSIIFLINLIYKVCYFEYLYINR